ncbi:type IV toxin-antitoxin system AbiEi family antitoxin domain-containing protein [Kribbella sp. NBC_01245]|uniref:type IV toxin-antitoxin system AbiEi family antitoxin domain-containing protein n=1 Tax=Kribbella sp. NBC_01245 TaxID=2903578 RepID=UPI002E2E5FC5|nr:type IV toxin-antitoxin system AbiEi family antitoxin domain-containing protein [Kribbella sp. NBC_01245]
MRQAVLLAELASEQWGLLTAAQAVKLGVTHQALAQLLREGAVKRVQHGVYRMTGAPPSMFDDIRAAWLAIDPRRSAAERLRAPDAVVCLRSAAWLHELGDMDADRYQFKVTGRRQSRRSDVIFRRGVLARDEWCRVEGLPVTTIVKTIGDLASAYTDGGHLANVVRDAITMAGVDAEAIIAILNPHARKYGYRDGEAVVSRFLEEAGLPLATLQAVALYPSAQRDNTDDARLDILANHPELEQRLLEISKVAVDELVQSREFQDALTSTKSEASRRLVTGLVLDSMRTKAAGLLSQSLQNKVLFPRQTADDAGR